MSEDCQGKDSWPELLGSKGSDAARIIESENSTINARVVPEGTMVTQDFLCTRVRVWVNTDSIVISVPIIG